MCLALLTHPLTHHHLSPTPALNHLPGSPSKDSHNSCSYKSSHRGEERTATAPALASNSTEALASPAVSQRGNTTKKYGKVKHPRSRLQPVRNRTQISEQINCLPIIAIPLLPTRTVLKHRGSTWSLGKMPVKAGQQVCNALLLSSGLSLFMVVMFCRVAVKTQLLNTEPLLLTETWD